MEASRRAYLKQMFQPKHDRDLIEMRIWEYYDRFNFNKWEQQGWPDAAWNLIAADGRLPNTFTAEDCRDRFAMIMLKYMREEWLYNNNLPRDGTWTLFKILQRYKYWKQFDENEHNLIIITHE